MNFRIKEFLEDFRFLENIILNRLHNIILFISFGFLKIFF